MAEVASAWVSLLPSAKGFLPKLNSQIGRDVESAGRKSGRRFGTVFATASLKPFRAFGAAALAFFAVDKVKDFFSASIAEARESQKVGALTTQVIKSTGRAAKISAKQVGNLSSAISKHVGIDDEAIQSGANLLLTFKNIRNESGRGNKVFNQATRAMTDMAAAMAAASGGEVDFRSSATMLGKALNDPAKGITALTRVGVTFTEQQKAQIKSLVASGKTMDAQKIILRELKSEFGGAAASQATAGQKMSVAWGNLKEQIGTALLPVLDGVERTITRRVIPAVSGFVDIVQGLDWGKLDAGATAIKDFVTAGAGHKALAASIDMVKRAVGPIRDGFASAAGSIEAIKTAVDGIDFSNLDSGQVGKFLGNAVATGLNRLVDLSGKLYDSFTKLLGKVDWVGLGIEVGKQMPALLLGLAAGIVNLDFGSLFTGIKDHWGEILIGVLAIAFAPSKLLGPLTRILSKIPFVGRFLAAAVVWISQLGGRMKGFAGDLVRSFAEGFGRVRIPGAGFIRNVLGALRRLPGAIFDFYRTLYTRIGVWALDAFNAAGRGARTATGKLLSFVGGIAGKVLSALGDLGGLLVHAGKELIDGLIRGIRSKVNDVGGAMKSIAKKIKGFLPGSPVKEGPLTSWNGGGAGKRLMSLLASGIRVSKGDVRDALRNVLQSVRDQIASVRDSIVSAFGGDLFSATNAKDFLSNLTATNGTVSKLKSAFNRLLSWGWKPEALSALFGSGNSALILDLASSKATAQAAAAQYQAVTTGLNQLGMQVGQAQFDPKTDVQIKTLKQLIKAVEHVGVDVGDALNTVSKNARRRRRHK